MIGRGSMGEVYEARSIADGKPAAVKLLHRHLMNEASQVARFVREAR